MAKAKLKLRPLHDRVIVQREEEERTSPGGIVIPDTATEKPIQGRVLAVGNGKILDGGDVRAPRREGRRQDPLRQVLRHRGQGRR